MSNSNFTNNLEEIQADNQLKPDLDVARRFLTIISQVDEAEEFTFQIFVEKKKGSADVHPKVLHDSLDHSMADLVKENLRGCGIFVTINRTDGKGRKSENIIGIRAVFVDLDGTPLQPVLDAPLPPHVIVESSPGRYHAYWIIEDLSLNEFTPVQKELAARFGGDPQISDRGRVMRLPGFFHLKHAPYRTTIINESGQQPFKRESFLRAFEIRGVTEEPRPDANDFSHDPVLEILHRNKLIVQKQGYPPSCWIMQCPWRHLHSKQDHGTKYYEPNFTDYPNGGFKCFHSHCADKTLKDLLAYLGIKKEISLVEPLPLHRPLCAPQPFPFAALGKILMPAALALQRVIQAPDAICAQSVLGAAALTCQPFANVFIDGREIPLSIFLITVAESGDRKSATDKIALKPIYMWQKMLADSFREEFKQFTQRKDLWESKKKEWMKEPSQGQFMEDAPVPALHPLVLVEEPTYEGIVKYLAIGQPSVGLFSDEGGRFFGGHAMNRDNQLKTLAGLSSLWDGKEISRLRGGDGNMLLFGRRVSLHLMIQEIILEKLMSNKLVEFQGFLPRCLISFPASTAGSRPYVEEDLTNDPAICHYHDRLYSLLDRKLPVDPYPAPQNELKPRRLILSGIAKKEWITYHNAIDQDLAPGKRLEQIRRLGNKAAEHVLRLAGNLAMIEQIETEQIEADVIERGIALVDYYLNEAMRIQGYLAIHPDLSLAQKLLQWCWSRGRDAVALQEIYQYGPSQIRQVTKARIIMSILERHGWAIPAPGIEIEGKFFKEAWIVRRLL